MQIIKRSLTWIWTARVSILSGTFAANVVNFILPPVPTLSDVIIVNLCWAVIVIFLSILFSTPDGKPKQF
jgi:hypothetical protein